VSDSTGNDPRPPSDIDPEQLRQFQEFQRFQEYQRFQQAQQGQTPPALPPGEHTIHPPAALPPGTPLVQTIYVKPEPKPWWKVVLTSSLAKWIARWVILLLILAFAANWAFNHYFGSGNDPGNVARDSGGSTGNVIAPQSPFGLQGTVGMFYKHVSQDSPKQACNLFAEDGKAKKKFAAAFSAPDCETAVHTLHSKVVDVSKYEQPVFPDSMLKPPTTDRVEVSSCRDLIVTGGPKLGRFVLSKQVNNTWVISDYEAEPADCVTG
jgi:hypothetical protein